MKRSTIQGLKAAVAAALIAGSASGAITREGEWPTGETISVDVTGATKAEAVQRIAQAAGWNVVFHAPPNETVDIHVKDQPAARVLELALGEGSFVARRDGTLIDIAPAQSAAPATAEQPPLPPPPEVPAPAATTKARSHAKDRVVSGGSLRIEKGEVVDDVTVFGGKVDVYGEVEGDLSVIGGSARVRDGARVHGDANAVGGKLRLDDGAIVDGDVGVIGGKVDRARGAKVGGSETGIGRAERDGAAPPRSWHARLWHDMGNTAARIALLFVFGAVLLSLATGRMESMKAELAQRPMRVFAVGVLAALAFPVALVVLCITVVGIPIAILAVLLGTFGAYAGVCAVLATAGKALVAHRTENEHIHLAVGCAAFFGLGAIPKVGGLVTLVVALLGLGVLVATRFAGFAPSSGKLPGSGPYRTAG